MKVVERISDLEGVGAGCVLSIGNFDGVHLGHQEILEHGRALAERKGVEFVVLTFEPHPVAVLYPERAPGVLTPNEMKRDLLAACGVDVRLVLKTTRKMLSLTPEEFVERFLVKGIKPSAVVEGHDFNFGRDRNGDVERLTVFGREKGFEVVIIDPKEVKLSTGQKVRVSSTMIRYMVESGHIADAAVSLGRPYRLAGKVIEGRGKGRELGFPTANMEKPGQVIPAEGVYAGYVGFGDNYAAACSVKATRPAVYSIGQARTYGDDFPLLIEAHLLDEAVEGLVGEYMAMDFVDHIRSQHKFGCEEELKAQIAEDCQAAKQILAKTPLE